MFRLLSSFPISKYSLNILSASEPLQRKKRTSSLYSQTYRRIYQRHLMQLRQKEALIGHLTYGICGNRYRRTYDPKVWERRSEVSFLLYGSRKLHRLILSHEEIKNRSQKLLKLATHRNLLN